MNFIKHLNTDINVRKIFGKREIKIIEKQLWGINLTQSEKNRLSRDIRKKLNFIKEASKFSDIFELKKGSLVKEIIEETKNIIKNDTLFYKIKRIILFGSVVENKVTFRSDIDIAVKFSKITLKESTLFRKRILSKANQKVDIQVYNSLPNKIKKEIGKKGKVLYEK